MTSVRRVQRKGPSCINQAGHRLSAVVEGDAKAKRFLSGWRDEQFGDAFSQVAHVSRLWRKEEMETMTPKYIDH